MRKRDFSNMSIAQCKSFLQKYKDKHKHIPCELKKEIEFQITKEEEENKIFTTKLIKSKWFSLGIIQTIKKRQATRILVGENIIYEMDTFDIMKNLIDLTFEAIKKAKTGFDFIKELSKLNNISNHNQYIE